MPKISPHAVIDPKAAIAADVEIGPFCLIGPQVTIGPGCRLVSSVTIMGHTTLGRDNIMHPNCVLGGPPQDKKYRGGATRLEIGDANIFREAVTIHVGTENGGGVTRVGNNNFLMVNSHLGHDVQMGNNCLLANNVMLGGHCICGDNVNMMGGAAVNHLVTIGDLAYVCGYSRIHYDVPPFCKVDGPDLVRSINSVGLRRAGYAPADIDALEDAHRALFASEQPLAVTIAEFDMLNGINPHVKRLIEFLQRRGTSRHGRHLESEMRRRAEQH